MKEYFKSRMFNISLFLCIGFTIGYLIIVFLLVEFSIDYFVGINLGSFVTSYVIYREMYV